MAKRKKKNKKHDRIIREAMQEDAKVRNKNLAIHSMLIASVIMTLIICLTGNASLGFLGIGWLIFKITVSTFASIIIIFIVITLLLKFYNWYNGFVKGYNKKK